MFFHKPMLDLVEKMIPLMPKGLDRFFFANSGSEAVEGTLEISGRGFTELIL
jgi:adenosylmethionine-8-amino-7-oxononanoate aminotransferase